jgi:hypothetical protein
MHSPLAEISLTSCQEYDVQQMMTRALYLSIAFSCSTVFAICQQRDSIYLYNGQILIGDIQSASLGTISIDDIDMKIQNVKLYKIRRLTSRQVFKIETYGKVIYYGAINAAKEAGWLVIRPDSATFPITNIHNLVPLDRSFFKSLDGNLSAGFSFAKSSGIGQINLSTTIRFSTKLWQYQLQASEIGSIDSGKFSRDNERAQLFAAYDLGATWFLAGVVQYQRNLELSIARRFLELLGAGNKLFVKDTWQLLVVSGLSLSQERSTAGEESSALFEIPVMFRFNFYQFHHPNIQISTSQTTYFSLTEKNRIRFDGTTSITWELIRYFNLSIDPYSSFDSKPPSGNGHTFDYGFAFSLSYRF